MRTRCDLSLVRPDAELVESLSRVAGRLAERIDL
jgi:hypothetical protein